MTDEITKMLGNVQTMASYISTESGKIFKAQQAIGTYCSGINSLVTKIEIAMMKEERRSLRYTGGRYR